MCFQETRRTRCWKKAWLLILPFIMATSNAPHAEDPNEQKYYEAYTAVTELLKRCPTVIKDLREPPCSIDEISAGEIRELCPDYPGDFNRLVSKF